MPAIIPLKPTSESYETNTVDGLMVSSLEPTDVELGVARNYEIPQRRDQESITSCAIPLAAN